MTSNVNKMVKISVLSALSMVLMILIRFPIIPSAPYLEYEPADVPLLIIGFMYGPLAGILATIIVSVIQAFTVSAGGGWVGLVMHLFATGAFVLVSSTIYRKMHTMKGAIISLIAGTIAMALVMIPCNLFFTVRFYGVPYDAVVASLPTVVIPFNLIKAGLNSILTLLVYKSLRKVFQKIN